MNVKKMEGEMEMRPQPQWDMKEMFRFIDIRSAYILLSLRLNAILPPYFSISE